MTLLEEDKIERTIKKVPKESFTVLDFMDVFQGLHPEDWERLVQRFGEYGEKKGYTVTTYLSNRLDLYSQKSNSMLRPLGAVQRRQVKGLQENDREGAGALRQSLDCGFQEEVLALWSAAYVAELDAGLERCSAIPALGLRRRLGLWRRGGLQRLLIRSGLGWLCGLTIRLVLRRLMRSHWTQGLSHPLPLVGEHDERDEAAEEPAVESHVQPVVRVIPRCRDEDEATDKGHDEDDQRSDESPENQLVRYARVGPVGLKGHDGDEEEQDGHRHDEDSGDAPCSNPHRLLDVVAAVMPPAEISDEEHYRADDAEYDRY